MAIAKQKESKKHNLKTLKMAFRTKFSNLNTMQ